MDRANEQAEHSADYVGDHRGEYAWGWTEYVWEDNEIIIRMNILGYHEAEIPTHDECNKIRRFFIGSMAGVIDFEDENGARELIHYSVNRWFSHSGYQDKERDEKLGEKLARIIFVEVSLLNSGGSIMCKDRITSFDAPSKPLN